MINPNASYLDLVNMVLTDQIIDNIIDGTNAMDRIAATMCLFTR